MQVKVTDIMSHDVVYGTPQMTAKEAAAMIADKNVSCLVIRDGTKALGIVTAEDLVARVMASGIDPENAILADIMTRPLVTIEADADAIDAARLMRDRNIKKLVIVEGTNVRGLLTSFDLVAAEPVMGDD